MFLAEEVECLIQNVEGCIYGDILEVVEQSCYTTSASLSTEQLKRWQLLYTVRKLLERKINEGSDSIYQCLINKLRK